MMNLNLLKKNQKKFKFDGNEKYIFNSKNDPPKLTISELGITNNANIFPISKDNSILRKKIQDYYSNYNEKKEKTNYNKEQENSDNINIISITFKTIGGIYTKMNFPPNISLCSVIKKYFLYVRPELLNSSESKKDIIFIYNDGQLNLDDKTSIEMFSNLIEIQG